MHFTFNILASSDDGMFKIIAGVVVFIIWGIGALANLSKKQAKTSDDSQANMERAIREQMEEARLRERAEALAQMNAAPRMMPPPMPPPPLVQAPRQVSRGPVVPPMRIIAQAQRPAAERSGAMRAPTKPQKRRGTSSRRAPVNVPALPEPVLSAIPDVVESEIGKGTTPASPARRQAALAVARIRLTPQSLRQQFIITEILQPPLALREQQ